MARRLSLGQSVLGGPDEKVLGSYDDYIEPFGTKAPEYGEQGLAILWPPEYEDGSVPGLLVVVPNFDVVVVHGLHGARRPPWKNPGSGDSSWFHAICRGDGRKVMSFGYDARKLLAGRQTRQAIRKAAIQLLDELIAERLTSKRKRSIMFLAHDIGGIIVKDALTCAGLDPRSYGDIFDSSQVLLFYGCPHRSIDRLDMEDRLSRFLFVQREDTAPRVAQAVSSIHSLAKAVIEVNNLFLDSKHAMRSCIISVYCQGIKSNIASSFDNFSGTMSLPFEFRFAGGTSQFDDGNILENYLISLQSQTVVSPKVLKHERSLLSIASSMPSLKTAFGPEHGFAWIRGNKTFQSWVRQKQPELLYVHGHTGTQEASEYIFYSLDQSLRAEHDREIVLYFTFDRGDFRRDTVQDMLATFLAQIINQFPGLADFVADQFERLSLDRSWSEFDLLSWFEYYRLRGEIDGVSCVINYFDECEESSRKAFLRLFSSIASVHEKPWRVVVTSREPSALLEELSTWATLDLDVSAPVSKSNGEEIYLAQEMETLVKRRPELHGYQEILKNELLGLASLDTHMRRIVLNQAIAEVKWPNKVSIKSMFEFDSAFSAEMLLDGIISRIPEPELGFRALSWILHSVRPLTFWELATAVYLGSEYDDGKTSELDPDFVDETISKILVWFAGIVTLEQHEIHILDPRIRSILMCQTTRKPDETHLWDDVSKTAHFRIAKWCLNYLMRDEARDFLETTYGEARSSTLELPTHGDRTNLSSYAVAHWTHHFSLIFSDRDSHNLLKSFIESKAIPIWSKAYWALANPIDRSPEYFDSLYPLLAGLGISGTAEQWCEGDKDLTDGLIEACLNGVPRVVHELLPRVNHPVGKLQEALVAAGSNGNEQLWVDVIEHIKDNYPGFPWPTSLLCRAAWLGFERVTSKLIELGVPVDPAECIQMETPLQLATRNGHLAVAKILLQHGANARHIGRWERNLLHVAAFFGHADLAEILAEAGAELDGKDEDRLTAVYAGSLWGNWKAVRALVDHKADPNIGDNDDPSYPGWTPLLVSAEEGHMQCALVLLEAQADPNIRGPSGTPLVKAVLKGRADMCRLFLDHGADPNHASISPPILIQAVTLTDVTERLEIVKILVEKGAKVNVEDFDGMTALLHSCQTDDEGMLPVISYLLDNKAAVNHKARNGTTALHISATHGNAEAVRLLLSRHADPNIVNKSLDTPLSLSVSKLEITRLLLEHKADPNLIPLGGYSPLMTAILENHLDAVKLLLEHNARVDLARIGIHDEFQNWTALAFAAMYGPADGVRLLADAGADVNHSVLRGRTLTHLAMDGVSLSALLEFRPDLDIQDDSENTALHEINAGTPLENIKLMVRGGASLEIQNSKKLTPLCQALSAKHITAAEYLLARQANVNAASPAFGGPLHIACKTRLDDVVPVLVNWGADVNLTVSGAAGTPLQSAILTFCNPGDDDATIEKIVDFLIASGADVNKVGGQFGSAVAAAAWQGSISLLEMLIRKASGVAIPDDMGRSPIHLAAVRSLDRFEILTKNNGNGLARDKAGRTTIHWAAQGGHAAVIDRIVELTGIKAIDQADIDGWTPLCWAARGGGTAFQAVSPEQQVEVVKLLLDKGADVYAESQLSGKSWTALSIAKYHSAGDTIIELLENSGTAENNSISSGDGNGGIPNRPVQRRLQHHPGAYCAYCLADILGFLYKCKVCIDFVLCYKCHVSRTALHPISHPFVEQGPEFEDISVHSVVSEDSEGFESLSENSDSDTDQEDE